jgi:Asp-tRNA(Asn)/Glu-tRNA(Gln) amidotransferase C subunit
LKTNPSADVLAILETLRQRIVRRRLIDAAAAAVLGFSGLLALIALVRWLAGLPPLDGFTALLLAALALAAAGLWLFARPDIQETAAVIDRLGDTRDRFITALALEAGSAPATPLRELARRECTEYLAARDFRPLIALRFPAQAAWAIAPCIAILLLQWAHDSQQHRARAQAEEASGAIARTVQQIEALARNAERKALEPGSEEMRRIAEQLKASAERLRAQTTPEEAQKAALRELSHLEEMVRELQRQPSAAEEMRELAKALGALPGMQDVLNALNENNLAEAQKAIERAMHERQEKGPDQLSEEQAAKAVQQAMQGLADRRRLSEALQKLADQMRQQGSQGASQQAMQQLAQMIEQAQQRQGDQATGAQQEGRQMSLQELIAALENMRFGEDPGGADQGSNEQTPGGGQQVSIQTFGSTNPQGAPQFGDAQQPSGRPGSERDFGTSDTPFGAASDPQEKGGELALKGRLGQGETLSMMLPSADDRTSSARRYRELYEAIAAEAQDAVEQEEIPLGSRLLIKRYFESIRPRD